MKSLIASLILTNLSAVATAVVLGGLWMLAVPMAAGLTVALLALDGDEAETE